jgi:hypothetical protein
MTPPTPKRAKQVYADRALEQENMRLRLRVEQLQDQIRKERRRADQLADDAALARQSYMDMIQRTAQRNGEVR